VPFAKDSYWGPGLVANLALVYAWTGERDRALEQLEIVAAIPAGAGTRASTKSLPRRKPPAGNFIAKPPHSRVDVGRSVFDVSSTR